MIGIDWVEAGRVPDAAVRLAIRRLLRKRLEEISADEPSISEPSKRDFLAELDESPIALVPELANEQHYEVPPAFFEKVLGPRLKYSSGIWSDGADDIDASEEAMLALTCERARIRDGMEVLDLGCGWGSLSLWIAEHYPNCRVLSVSNSKPQREFILGRCDQRGFDGVEVVTTDINQFETDRRFDRVVSVEMFEHIRNHDLLLRRIASWLKPDGMLFVHHFSHRSCAYPFETDGRDDWMGRLFFSGGIMPSDDLLLYRQRDLVLEDKWRVGGEHYQQTSDAWLANQDAHRADLMPILAEAYGADAAEVWFQRWRLFFLACSELFGYRDGNEWWVTHVLMAKRGDEQ